MSNSDDLYRSLMEFQFTDKVSMKKAERNIGILIDLASDLGEKKGCARGLSWLNSASADNRRPLKRRSCTTIWQTLGLIWEQHLKMVQMQHGIGSSLNVRRSCCISGERLWTMGIRLCQTFVDVRLPRIWETCCRTLADLLTP